MSDPIGRLLRLLAVHDPWEEVLIACCHGALPDPPRGTLIVVLEGCFDSASIALPAQLLAVGVHRVRVRLCDADTARSRAVLASWQQVLPEIDAWQPPTARPRRWRWHRPPRADQILRLLGARLDGWEVVEIEGRSEGKVARLLRESPIFLALGRQEGFGLPAAEAMASGCFVVGFPGFGGRELFDPQCSGPVEDGDVLGAAVRLAAAIELYESRPSEVREAGMRARRRIVEAWAPEEQRRALLDFYAGLLGTPGASAAAPDPLLVESK